MSFRKRIPAVALGAALAFSPILLTASPASAITPEEQAFVDAINAARVSAGLAPLTVSEELTVLAERHSASMGTSGTLSHTTDLAGAIGSVYADWTRIGENVGYGSTVEEINAALLASPEHAANIYGDYNLLGVGVYINPGGQMWVTELFAKATATTTTVSSPVVTSPVVTSTPLVSAPVASTSTATGPGHAKAAHVRSASSPKAAAAGAHTNNGVRRHGPPEWAQNERSGR
jgi:uncharacterized protein YkwD